MKIIFILWVPFALSIKQLCKPLCDNSKTYLYHHTNDIMTNLENEVFKNIEIMNIEIKMAILSSSLSLSKKIENDFKELNAQHKIKIKQYEMLLNSIGLSPAREDEIYLIEEMEKVAKHKTNPFDL